MEEDFNSVICNMLTGMTPVATEKQTPIHYSLVRTDKIPLYGQVNHYHSFENAPYKPVDEILYVVQKDEIFRQVLFHLLLFVCVCVHISCEGTCNPLLTLFHLLQISINLT